MIATSCGLEPSITKVDSTKTSSPQPTIATSTNTPRPTSTKTEAPTITISSSPSIILGEEIVLTFSGFSFRPIEGFEVGEIYAPNGRLFGATLESPSGDMLIELRGSPRSSDITESETIARYFATNFGIQLSDENMYSVEIQGMPCKGTMLVLGDPVDELIHAIAIIPNETYGFIGILFYSGLQDESRTDYAKEAFMTILENIVFFGNE